MPAVDNGNFSVCNLLRSQQARQQDIEGSPLLDSNGHDFLHRNYACVIRHVRHNPIQKFLTGTSPTHLLDITSAGCNQAFTPTTVG
jgi:hypothetical protein